MLVSGEPQTIRRDDHILTRGNRYGESVSLLSKSQDVIWHAAALEGQCTVQLLETWTAGHGIVRPSIPGY
jgi:hypothetical protein